MLEEFLKMLKTFEESAPFYVSSVDIGNCGLITKKNLVKRIEEILQEKIWEKKTIETNYFGLKLDGLYIIISLNAIVGSFLQVKFMHNKAGFNIPIIITMINPFNDTEKWTFQLITLPNEKLYVQEFLKTQMKETTDGKNN